MGFAIGTCTPGADDQRRLFDIWRNGNFWHLVLSGCLDRFRSRCNFRRCGCIVRDDDFFRVGKFEGIYRRLRTARNGSFASVTSSIGEAG